MVSRNLEKMTRRIVSCVPIMLCVTGLMAACLSGCGKGEKPVSPAEKPSGIASVEERMADPVYVKELDEQRDEMKRLVKLSAKATNEADRAALAAALEKNRRNTMELIRARMQQKGLKEISK